MKALGVVAVTGVLVVALSGCGIGSFTGNGTIIVNGNITTIYGTNGGCHGTGGYTDMREGTQVKVSSEGKTVGVGSLKMGHAEYPARSCTFEFAVDGLPVGKKFYSLEVSHRGALEYTEDELRNGVSLSLGS